MNDVFSDTGEQGGVGREHHLALQGPDRGGRRGTGMGGEI